ncbi:lipase family protein [Poseidonocella sedimentorum]|uniref:Lipase (Class 3) n=1 Tax=Poseidonocella sedimentorum TaxID=871652 RepID=A0A1I6DKV9_9RHOB|nr:hypothetical protein [Poseidonocella sedimentorum]SFR06085.1 Lipase (class 3) [Poseidonocella sedimentorum]
MTQAEATGRTEALLTLAAIAYVDDSSQDAGKIGEAIEAELQKLPAAISEDWSLAFGPVIFPDTDSLLFVAENAATQELAVVLRGTAPDDKSRAVDYPAKQIDCTYCGMDGAKVSAGYMWAMTGMVGVESRGQSLGDFLKARADGSNALRIYVTGHSQGAGVAPLLLAWIIDQSAQWSPSTPPSIQCQAFAPLSTGNPAFATWIAQHADCILFINPLDIIPFMYADIQKAIDDGIPTTIPANDRKMFETIKEAADAAGQWEQVPNTVTLESRALPSSMSFENQKDGQHNVNSYLVLMGYPQTDVGAPSPFAS